MGDQEAAVPDASVYERYKLEDQILLRPDTYVGSVQKRQTTGFVLRDGTIVEETFESVDGLYKIFDEILVNATDNRQRDASMDLLEVVITDTSFCVRNNGAPIPITMHPTEKQYVPEMVFGTLLTSSNYKDKKKKTTGGRNGYGAKLCNLFCRVMTVIIDDGTTLYRQTWKNNMKERGEPVLAKSSGKRFTEVHATPDLARFGLSSLASMRPLMERRVWDCAGTTPADLVVRLNKKIVRCATFKSYVRKYRCFTKSPAVEYVDPAGRWHIFLSASEGFRHVSFVNNIYTAEGGTHVERIVRIVTKYVSDNLKGVLPKHVRSNLTVFVNCFVDNPAFSSQVKSHLSIRPDGLPPLSLPKEVLQSVQKQVSTHAKALAELRDDKNLKKTDSKRRAKHVNVDKLDDAIWAGTTKGAQCTLILTEGDSAKALAVSGYAVLGRERYGIFPLKGKLLNVRNATKKVLAKNEEFVNLKTILGLKQGQAYDDIRSLRYGRVIIMADQDHDGAHIKALVLNMFHFFWPELARRPGFLASFVTPIVRCTNRRTQQRLDFYALSSFEQWLASCTNFSSWKIKYYKGLGSSTSAEAIGYFKNMNRTLHSYRFDPEADARLHMLFDKRDAAGRKSWLLEPMADELPEDATTQDVTNFLDGPLKAYARASNIRAVPSMVDGLKPAQRKVLYTCFKRKFSSEVNVAQLSGAVTEVAKYHHGAASLQKAIQRMAETFVGSGNVNYLLPYGQFGTRLAGGKDSASPRYTWTAMAPGTRHLFPACDDAVLSYVLEDGQSCEPTHYVPLLPMVLVNGVLGIGTGHNTRVPSFRPADIVRNLRQAMRGEEQTKLVPWHEGFKGRVYWEESTKPNKKPKVVYEGHFVKNDDGSFTITELPYRVWTDDFLDALKAVREASGNFEYENRSTDKEVCIIVSDISRVPELKTSMTPNYTLHDADGRLRVYDSAEHIIEEFLRIRLATTERRKAEQLKKLEAEFRLASEKARFIGLVNSQQVSVFRRPQEEILRDLSHHGFEHAKQLLTMSVNSFTKEREEDFKADARMKESMLQDLRGKTAQDIFQLELDTILAHAVRVDPPAHPDDAYSAPSRPGKRRHQGQHAKSKRTKRA